jgi:hypothetical protein
MFVTVGRSSADVALRRTRCTSIRHFIGSDRAKVSMHFKFLVTILVYVAVAMDASAPDESAC